MSVRIKDKKIHSTPVQRRLDVLAGEVEKLREQIKKKLQQLEELQRILNSQNTFRSEELPSEVERLIIELQKVAKLSPSRKIPELLEANASMQRSLATAEEEHRKILMTLLSVLRRKLETSQKRLGKFQYVASLLIGEVDRLEKERIEAGKLQEHVQGLLNLASSMLEERLVLPREPIELDAEKRVLAINVGDRSEVIPLSPDPYAALEGVLDIKEPFKKLRKRAEILAEKEAEKRATGDAAA